MSFHNTTDEKGEQLNKYENQAASQETKIASFFELNPGEIFTPWEVQSLVFYKTKTPITSVRRSLSDLTRAGVLTKTEHMKEAGNYGRRSFSWQLNETYYKSLQAMQEILAPVEPPEEAAEDIRPEITTTPTDPVGAKNEPKTQGLLFQVPTIGQTTCMKCGKPLSDPKSVARGMGPVCAKCKIK